MGHAALDTLGVRCLRVDDAWNSIGKAVVDVMWAGPSWLQVMASQQPGETSGVLSS